jgi:hypothetical protein
MIHGSNYRKKQYRSIARQESIFFVSETVRGKPILSADKGFNARCIKFFDYGEGKKLEYGQEHSTRVVILMPHASTESNLF